MHQMSLILNLLPEIYIDKPGSLSSSLVFSLNESLQIKHAPLTIIIDAATTAMCGGESRLQYVRYASHISVGWRGGVLAHKLLARMVCQEMSHGVWLAGAHRLCTHTRPIEHAATMPTGSLSMPFQYNKPLPVLINQHDPRVCNT